MVEAPHILDGQFEAPAEAMAKNNPRLPAHEIAAISLAISIKRIADEICDNDRRAGLNWLLNEIVTQGYNR